MSLLTNEQLDKIIEEYGWRPTATAREQLRVMLEAFDIFMQRDHIRKGLWQEQGYADSALQLRSKASRVSAVLTYPENEEVLREVIDDALDAINYAVFFVRNVRDELQDPGYQTQ